MTTFDKREEGFERNSRMTRVALKANARRTSCWIVGRPRKSGSAARGDAYAKEVVMADFEEAGDDDVFRKVRKTSTPRAWRSPIISFAAPWTS